MNRVFFYHLAAFLLFAQAQLACMQPFNDQFDTKQLANYVGVAQQELQEASRRTEENFTRKREALYQKRILLATQFEKSSKNNRTVYEQQLRNIDDELARIDEDEKAARNMGGKVNELFLNGANGYIEYTTQKAIEEERRQTSNEKAAIEQDGAFERLKLLLEPRNMAHIALYGGTAAAGLVATHHMCRLGVDYTKAALARPKLVDETSRLSWQEYVSTLWYGNPIVPSIADVVLPEVITHEIQLVAATLQTCVQYRIPFSNLLLYGPPGTGKTMFARSLALSSGMDYAIIKGPKFAQFFASGTHLQALEEIFAWAQQCPKGLIIFIDEAESFCKSRTLPNSPQMHEVLQAFLSHTGSPSTKYMFVFASNHPEQFDSAIVSRTSKQIFFPLPGTTERSTLIKMYLEKQLQAYEQPLKLEPGIDQAWYQQVAQQCDGSTGRQIEQVAIECAKLAYTTNKGVISKELFTQALHNSVQQQAHVQNWKMGG